MRERGDLNSSSSPGRGAASSQLAGFPPETPTAVLSSLCCGARASDITSTDAGIVNITSLSKSSGKSQWNHKVLQLIANIYNSTDAHLFIINYNIYKPGSLNILAPSEILLWNPATPHKTFLLHPVYFRAKFLSFVQLLTLSVFNKEKNPLTSHRCQSNLLTILKRF